ncbi:MAG: DUF2213 domain-containing protein [Deltaproteobacteria bacterium]|jgi:hypothetical protein|nr:DUF2213 domain-containing protein [Deltaproteobacteria bacterium]
MNLLRKARGAAAGRKRVLSFDGSVSRRRKDENGFLHVDATHISKEEVTEYWGWEIPGFESLGLSPDRLYRVYRPAEELEKAARSFDNLPLLLMHHPDSADSPQIEFRVGSVGSNGEFVRPYLDNSIAVTVQEAIDAVESGACRELSCAYFYDPDPTPGEFEGKRYDLVQRNIRGNHVALVDEGRCGPDVAVADAKEAKMGTELTDTLSKVEEVGAELQAAAAAVREGVAEAVQAAVGEAGIPAPDSEPEPAAEPKADQEPEEAGPKAADSGGEEPKDPASDSDPAAEVAAWLDTLPDQEGAGKARELISALVARLEAQAPAPAAQVPDQDPEGSPEIVREDAEPGEGEPKASDGGPEGGEPKGDGEPEGSAPAQDWASRVRRVLGRGRVPKGGASDAALAKARSEGAAAAERRMAAEYKAKAAAAEAVRPIIGAVQPMAFDSAAAIYRRAVEAEGRKTGITDPAALRELVEILAERRVSALDMGTDSKPASAKRTLGALEADLGGRLDKVKTVIVN